MISTGVEWSPRWHVQAYLTRCISIGPLRRRVEHCPTSRPGNGRIAEWYGGPTRTLVQRAGWSFTTSPGTRSRRSSRGASRSVGSTSPTSTARRSRHRTAPSARAGPPSYRSVGLPLRSEFSKYSALQRAVQEVEYGWRFARLMRSVAPDVVISANAPLISAFVLQLGLLLQRVPVVFWQQDIYSMALSHHFEKRGGAINRFIGRAFVADREVVAALQRTGRRDQRGLPEPARGVGDRRVQGVGREELGAARRGLGVAATESVVRTPSASPTTRPCCCTQARWVSSINRRCCSPSPKRSPSEPMSGSSSHPRASARRGSPNGSTAPRLELIPFQPYADLPDMLGSGDVLLVLLEPDAGVFSVPSKVLTYHCAGRAILGAIPGENLAARTIESNGAGVVVDPGDSDGFVAAALELIDDPAAPCRHGIVGSSCRRGDVRHRHHHRRIRRVCSKRHVGRPIAVRLARSGR